MLCAVGREDILKFLEEDARRSDVMELDNRLYMHQTVPVKSTRSFEGLCRGAASFIYVFQLELDSRFLNPDHTSKNWLANDAVLAATLVTPGGAAMMRKAAARVGQDDPIDGAHAAVVATAESLIDASASTRARQQELKRARKRCRTTIVDWESDESRGAAESAPAGLVRRELDGFLATCSASVNTGVLKFWSAREDEYPLLMLVACAPFGHLGHLPRPSGTSRRPEWYCASIA